MENSANSQIEVEKMEVSPIQIFARIRPIKVGRFLSTSNVESRRYHLDQPEPENPDTPQLHFVLPRDEDQGLINNSREKFDFRFNRVFDQSTKQEEVYDHVAKDVVESVVDGFNGTIFAYGQTGSGKSYTITGGAEKYADRGLIPRVIQDIFARIDKDSMRQYSVTMSYMEVYNESGYDLLQNNRENLPLDRLPKIQIHEDDENFVMKNLTEHRVDNEEEGLNLLFMGDTNKMIAETPSNPASSRSHCIFTINIQIKEKGSARIRRSKLNLVDLAGSERAHRTKIDGATLKEAKFINLSLHFLEQVIVALHERSLGLRSHIPYRNSMMTSILRDSLGGNCKTRMIANLAVEPQYIDETISTCRFAQRVALIKNDAFVNEELDLSLVIQNLKAEIERLKAELALANGGSYSDEPLPGYEKERIEDDIKQFINGQIDCPIYGDMRKIIHALQIMKQNATSKGSNREPQIIFEDKKETRELKEQVHQRDIEIGVLVSMLREMNPRASIPSSSAAKESNYTENLLKFNTDTSSEQESKVDSTPDPAAAPRQNEAEEPAKPEPLPMPSVDKPLILTQEDHMRAFNEFKSTYKDAKKYDDLKDSLKQAKESARMLGTECQKLKTHLSGLKGRIEKLQMNKIMLLSNQSPGLKSTDIALLDLEISELKEDLDVSKHKYSQNVAELKDSKKECDHIMHAINGVKSRLVKDFEVWLVETKYRGYKVQMETKKVVDASHHQLSDSLPQLHSSNNIQKKQDRRPHSRKTSRPSSRASEKLRPPSRLQQLSEEITDSQVQKDIAAFLSASSRK